MQYYADLHIHSPFSMATSKSMTPALLLAAAARKGIGILGSGDALHPMWRAMWKDTNDTEILVVPSAEDEDRFRIHHLLLMENFDCFAELAERLSAYGKSVTTNGRPHVSLSGGEIAAMVHELGGLIGPAHAFTPWTSLYASFDRISDCYGSEPVDFLELGLSADSSYGAAIPDLAGIPFLSNSDAHSPQPLKVGREFNRVAVGKKTAQGLLDAVSRGKITLNAGFFPEEGKYNRTACIGCFRQYTLSEAVALKWRCPIDKKRIKKGVRDRACELSAGTAGSRPPYLHIIPLQEIIRQTLGTASPATKACNAVYERLLAHFTTEIEVLVTASVDEIERIDPGVGNAVDCLRSGRIVLHPGGGGRYGSFSLG